MVQLNYNNKKALESQKKIYKALRQVLLRKNLEEVTVSDICEECEISRSTFYRNFNNIIDVLDVILDFFYARYLRQREEHNDNRLLFFFEYWGKHRDLIHIISHNHEILIKKCILKYEYTGGNADFLANIKTAMLSTILCKWSESKKETPKEMEEMTRSVLNQRCIDILLN